MSSTRITNGFFNRSRQLISSVTQSTFATKASSAVDGAVKAAFGIHYLFNLGYQLTSLSAPHTQAFKITQWTITGFTFAMSTFHGFKRSRIAKNYYEKADLLNEQLLNSDKILNNAENIIKQSKIHLELGGYQCEHSIEVMIPATSEIKSSKSLYDQCSDSKPMIGLKTLLDATMTATGVYYMTNLGSEWTSTSQSLDVLKGILIGATLMGKLFIAYEQRKMDLRAKIKAANLANDIAPIVLELTIMKKRLGTSEQLKSIIHQGEKLTQQSVHLGITEPLSSNPLSPPVSESASLLWFKAVLNGAAKASGVHYMLEIIAPNQALFRYVLAGLTLVITSYRAHLHSLSDSAFHQQITSTQNTIDELNELITLANKILLMEARLVAESMTEKKSDTIDCSYDSSHSDLTLSCDLDRLTDSSLLSSSSTEVNQDHRSDIELCHIKEADSSRFFAKKPSESVKKPLLGGCTDDLPPRYHYQAL